LSVMDCSIGDGQTCALPRNGATTTDPMPQRGREPGCKGALRNRTYIPAGGLRGGADRGTGRPWRHSPDLGDLILLHERLPEPRGAADARAASATSSTPRSGFLPTIGCASSDAAAISSVPRSATTIAPCPPVALRHGCTPAEASATLASRQRRGPRRVNGYGYGAVMSGAPRCPRQAPPVRPSSQWGEPPAAG
jgi:hypothetical protein